MAATCWRRLRLKRSTSEVLMCQPSGLSTCWTAASVPKTTRCVTSINRRRRVVLTTCAESNGGRGIQRGVGRGPLACCRGGCTQCPECVSKAARYARKPSVTKSGAQSGARIWVTWWTKRCAMAWVRAPTSMATSSLVTGSMATQTQGGARDKRLIALASLISPALTALRTAYSSSSCHGLTWTSQRQYAEKAQRCSAASTSQASTVLGATSKTRAVARMPKPSAKHASTWTMSSPAACLP
jgi:hypothetical protein